MNMPFQPFGSSHLLALTAIFAFSLILCTVGRGVRSTVLGLLILIVHIPYQMLAMMPKNFNIQHSIPLHLCDLAWMVCAIALLTQSRWSQRLIFYWGLTLTPQALLTPALKFDYPDFVFIAFWIDHGLVFIGTMFIVFVLKFRPDRHDFYRAYGLTLLWGVLVLVFNSQFNTNYMFLNHKPPKSILDFMGPWPQYLIVEAALIGLIWYFLLTSKRPARPYGGNKR